MHSQLFVHSAATASKNIVITGGSKGLGFAMAREFLTSGHRVVICGRDTETLARAEAALGRDGEVYATRCDVSNVADVQGLVQFARRKLGRVDVFINNAGRASATRKPLWELDPEV